jgi:Fe-S-cluster containining protein
MENNEVPYNCDACGACCRTFPIRVSKQDGEREPRIAEHALVVPAWERSEEHYYHLHPLPFCKGCLFLGEDNLCSVYETRPQVCRRFAAGSAQCQEARARKGLQRLKAAI